MYHIRRRGATFLQRFFVQPAAPTDPLPYEGRGRGWGVLQNLCPPIPGS